MKKVMKKIAVVTAVAVAVTTFPEINMTQEQQIVRAATAKVSTYAELVAAAAKGGTYTIGASFKIKEAITIESGKTLTLVSESEDYILSAAEGLANMFVVKGTLKLGSSTEDAVTVKLRGGTSTENYTTSSIVKVDGGTVTINKATLYKSASRALLVTNAGTATMNGGSITTNAGTNSSGTIGGSVLVKEGATFHLKGGTIIKSGNGGVYVAENATFEMSGGSISNNAAGAGTMDMKSLQYGGGVYVVGTFDMSGGKIYENSAFKAGAGVSVEKTGKFYLSGSASIHSSDDVYLAEGQKIYVKDTLTGTAPVATVNLANETLGTTIAETTITALQASDIVNKFALQNNTYKLAAKEKAVFLTKGYTITYVGNGGLHVPEAVQANWSDYYTVPESNPSRTGYTFAGWNTNIDGTGTSYVAGNILQVKDNVSFYAQWKENDITITYQANGGENAPSSETQKYSAGVKVSYTEPTRIGYTFTGWNTKEDGSGVTYVAGTVLQENITLYAQWSLNKISVSYQLNGGTNGPDSVVEGSAIEGIIVTNIQPQRPDYVFAGWNTAQDGSGVTYAAGTKVLANVTLYAQWKQIVKVSVVYVVSGGYFTGLTTIPYQLGEYATITTEQPSKDGYTFMGWNTKEDGTGTTYQAGAILQLLETTNLYAMWSENASKQATISQYTPSISVTSKTAKLSLKWSLSGQVEGYDVYYATSKAGKWKKYLSATTKTSTTYIDKNLRSGKPMYFKATAFTILNGKKVYSKTSKIVSATLLTQPTLSSVSYSKKSKKVTMKWKKNSQISGYEIYQKIAGGTYKKIYTAKKTSKKLMISLKSVKKGKQCSYKIRTYTKADGKKIYSAYSNVKSVKRK